jgi:hypothetical protein
MTTELAEGKCRVCGCTELAPCIIGGGDGNPAEPCAWFDIGETLCTNPRCIAEFPLETLLTMMRERRAFRTFIEIGTR